MGACVSRECMRGDSAKLILLDGTLEEFSYPVKVWQILQKYPTSFVCNSDEMDFDDTVSASLATKSSDWGNFTSFYR
ncbi:hypothetical protein HID58_007967 [Brassica napus]|uniref:Uncharacterized protein n=1 Tax=Brassica napus TaxID=3708 RepID=A0ABQ7XI07_BRANA|nr:hypothetical protein HID58_007967 [Brassica napus]